MGTTHPVMKLAALSVALVVAINLHSTSAVCRLATPRSAGPGNGAVAPAIFTALSDVNQACGAACTACGTTLPAAEMAAGAGACGADGNTMCTAANVNAVGNEVCPTITYNAIEVQLAAGGAANVPVGNCPYLGGGIAVDVGATSPGQGISVQPDTADSVPVALTSLLLSTSGFMDFDAIGECGSTAGAGAAVGSAQKHFICPCQTASVEGLTACPICGCSALGVPTNAPTALPTTAPTTAPSSPTSTSASISGSSSSDDSLSGGAIAGIVIGSVVGAALVIGAGVMIGSK